LLLLTRCVGRGVGRTSRIVSAAQRQSKRILAEDER
jgi:hypothetical protein